jgi:hypothetical protein
VPSAARRSLPRPLQGMLGASFRVCIGIVVGYKVQDNAMLEKLLCSRPELD